MCCNLDCHSDGILYTDLREVPSFSKKAMQYGKKNLFNWTHVLRKYFSNCVYLKDTNKTLKKIGIIQFVPKLTIFPNL